MWQTGYVAAEGKEVVISRASADCKRQSVLRADGYGKRIEVLYKQPRHKATAAMSSNKALLFPDTRKIFFISCTATKQTCMHIYVGYFMLCVMLCYVMFTAATNIFIIS